jgi:hypothetical protein
MTAPTQQDIPPTPPELPAVHMWQPKKRKGMQPGHWALIALAALPLAFLVSVGAYTVARPAFSGHSSSAAATTKPTVRHSAKPAGPVYNLAGYRSTISGPEAQAFVTDLNKLRSDIRMPNYPAAAMDAPQLITAAGNWLTALRATNPPPQYGPQKLAYMQAATAALTAGQTCQRGLQTANLTLLQRGAGQIANARALLHNANAPEAHATGS